MRYRAFWTEFSPPYRISGFNLDFRFSLNPETEPYRRSEEDVMKHKVQKEGKRHSLRFFPLKYGGTWSVVSAAGSEVYFPSEDEAEAYYNRVEALIEDKSEKSDDEAS